MMELLYELFQWYTGRKRQEEELRQTMAYWQRWWDNMSAVNGLDHE